MATQVSRSTAVSAPRLALIGLCDRSVEVREGDQAFWHRHLLGLSNTRVSFVYPINLRGHKFVFAVYEPQVCEDFVLVLRPGSSQKPFDLKFSVSGATMVAVNDPSIVRKLSPGDRIPGWVFAVETVGIDLPVYEPCICPVFQSQESGEYYLGQIEFMHVALPPFTPDQIAAIKSDPLAAKAAGITISCRICGRTLRAYTGLERHYQKEAEGWVWHQALPDRFKCECGEQEFSLNPIRTGLHGLLLRGALSAAESTVNAIRLYENESLKESCRQFLNLLDSCIREEQIQTFLEANPIFFHVFAPAKLMVKKPVLTHYFVDFAVLNERKELLLIEIELPKIGLVKKDGGITANLQKALDQVRKWIQVFDEHRVAALQGFGLKLEDVVKVRGVVIAGRTPNDEAGLRLLRAASWEDIVVYTYDDILKSVTGVIKQVASS